MTHGPQPNGFAAPLAATHIQASDELPAGPDADELRTRGVELWRNVHSFMRHACLARPLLRYQLRQTNLETLERGAPPAGHWDAVLEGVDAFSWLSEDTLTEICEVWGLFSQAMVSDEGPGCCMRVAMG